MKQCRKKKELQERMNYLNDTAEFHEVESNSCGIFYTFPVNQQVFQVLVLCGAAINACHLTHGTCLDHRKTFSVINLLHLIRPEIIIKEFIILRHQVLQDWFPCILVQGLLSQEMKIELEAQFQCRHLQEGRRRVH